MQLLLGNRLLGPIIYDENLNGERYLQMLRESILPLIRDAIPPEDLQELWFQQDGCPAHNTRQVMEFLREHFGNRIICNNGPVAWPARSPDLTPLDFFLWGYVKNKVYEFESPENRVVLENRLREILGSITRTTLQKVTATVLSRCEKCIGNNGQHVI